MTVIDFEIFWNWIYSYALKAITNVVIVITLSCADIYMPPAKIDKNVYYSSVILDFHQIYWRNVIKYKVTTVF